MAMRIALVINEAVSHDRHADLDDPALRLPPGEVVSREQCLDLNPLIDPAGVTGGAVWHDYQLHSTDRMTFAFVLFRVVQPLLQNVGTITEQIAAAASLCWTIPLLATELVLQGRKILRVRA